MDKTKVLYLSSAFSIKDNSGSLPTASDQIDSIYIEGYASTNDVDRAGDVVSTAAWEKGIQNYLKNPIILAQHDYDDPVGRMVDYKIDKKGLWIKARVSAAAEIFNLVKDKVLTAFSIGFRVIDAEYNNATEIFMVKELELVEISIVSVPCNQNTIFSLAKAFDRAEDYNEFKKQFATPGNVAKGLKSNSEADGTTQKEWDMNPEEIKQMLADAAKNAAEQATKSLLAAQAEQAQKAAAEAKAAEEFEAKVKAAVAASVKTVDTGAERLLDEVTKRLESQSEDSKKALAGLEAVLKEKSDELAKLQASKMSFADNKGQDTISYAEKEKAVLLATVMRKGIQDTKFGKQLLEKANVGGHILADVWELEVSLNMENEVRRRLVAAPLFRQIQMQTNVMKIPLNPEAGTATWIQNSEFGNNVYSTTGGTGTTPNITSTTTLTNNSSGATATQALKDITLSAYKVATREYLNFEEEEDSLIVLLPIIRDAMVRRLARSMDKAILLGAGSGTDPVKGLASYYTSLTTGNLQSVGPVATKVTVGNLRTLRAGLGPLGLDPADVTYIVNTDVYYNLLEDSTFQTMNQVGTQATLLTGQIGQIGNSPVLVSGELPASTANASASSLLNVGALAVYTPNFVIGSQRGLRMDTQDLVERQSRVMVASMRVGFQQLVPASGFTNGGGVTAWRFTT